MLVRVNLPTYAGCNYPRYANWEAALRDVSFKSPVYSFRSSHVLGCNFLFCDGSVRFINQYIEMPAYKALGSRNGGEPAGDY